MSITKHTPGPWKFEDDFVRADALNDSDHGNVIADVQLDSYGKGISFAEREANARLLARAPETLAERDKLKDVLALVLDKLGPHFHQLGVKKAYSELVIIAQARKLILGIEEWQSIEELNKII